MNFTHHNYRGARIAIKNKISIITDRSSNIVLRVCEGSTTAEALDKSFNIVDNIIKFKAPEQIVARRLADKYLIK